MRVDNCYCPATEDILEILNEELDFYLDYYC